MMILTWHASVNLTCNETLLNSVKKMKIMFSPRAIVWIYHYSKILRYHSSVYREIKYTGCTHYTQFF